MDKGERVLSPNQNKDLTKYLNSGKVGNQPVQNTNNIRVINTVDSSVFSNYLGTMEGEQVVMNIVRANQR